MLTVGLNWIYIFFTTLCMGFGAGKLVEKHLHYHIRHLDSIVGLGLVLATVYAQIWSLCYKVGVAANVVLVLFCMVIVLCCRKEIVDIGRQLSQSSNKKKGILLFLLILVWTYCTSRGYMHYDSDLYHAQSIRWIEEYGVVKGLGNIHVRFAYNSSFFALSALYSLRFVFGQSLHCVNGFIALLLSVEAFRIGKAWKRKKLLLSDWARVGAIYYLTLVYKEIMAPASDYAVMCVVFYIIIKWLALLEDEQESKQVTPYALLCVAGVFAVSLKLTTGLLLLLVIKPVSMLIREKRWKEIVLYLCMGIWVIVPWLARTVIISGYLLYPFPALDLFSVDWKISAEAAALDAAEIKTWGRGLNDASLIDVPITQWLPSWFQTTLPAIGKVLVLADLSCLVIGIVYAIITVCRRKWEKLDFLLAWTAVAVSFFFWLTSAPLLRYGYAYVLLLVAMTGGEVLVLLTHYFGKNCHGKRNWCFDNVLCLALLAVGIVKLWSLGGFIAGSFQLPYYVNQQDYGKYELDTFTVEGISFYIPVSGDRVGYDAFPAVPRKVEVKLRGEGLKDGFISSVYQSNK